MILRRIFVILAASVFAAPIAHAQDPLESVLEAVEILDGAKADFEARNDGADATADLTSVVLAYERGLAALRVADRRVKILRKVSELRLAHETDELSRLLVALQSAGDPSAPQSLLHPDGPLAAARAALLMAEMVPVLEGRAAAVRDRLAGISSLDVANTRATQALQQGRKDVVTARIELGKVTSAKGEGVSSDRATQIMHALAVAGGGLEEFALALTENASASDIDGEDEFVGGLGTFQLPVGGRFSESFPNLDGSASQRPGISLESAPKALVTAPFRSTLRYSGVLSGYGKVMILEAAPGYLLIVAGLETVFATAGEVLPKGAPLGLMGGDDAISGDNAKVERETLNQTLYVETREDGTPVDPATWFALDKERN